MEGSSSLCSISGPDGIRITYPVFKIRSKWKSSNNGELKPGLMVIIKEDHTAPFQWPIGRITEIHPGPDSIVRVVTVKTSKGTLKRAFNKICPLPA